MEIKKDLISERYKGDNISLSDLGENQKRYLELFLKDNRIKYEVVSQCFLCNSCNFILIAEKDVNAIPLKTIVCENCGLVMSYKRMNKESAGIFYSEYYRNIYESLDTCLINKRYEHETQRKIPKYLRKDKVILEIGCGGGWNLMPFLKRGYKHYGFDFDKDFIEQGRKKGLNLFSGGVEQAIEKNIKCDYLLLDQVLEHLDDPVSFLKSLKPILNKNAVINIFVPSLDLLVWGYVNYDLLGTLQIAHNYLFDEFTLKTISRKAGFKVLNCVATNLVLQNSEDIAPAQSLLELSRGEKIVKYLKFVEKTLSLRKKIGAEKILLKKLYCVSNPIGCYKRFSSDYLGKI